MADNPYIFVSYSHVDSASVLREIDWLNASGYELWHDEGISAGAEWTNSIAKALKGSSLVVYYVTPASAASPHCRNEINFAIEQDIPIIAVHLEETELPDGLALALSSRQALFTQELSREEFQQKLTSAVSTYLHQPRTAQAPAKRSRKAPLVAGVSVLLVAAVVILLSTFPSEDAADSLAPDPRSLLVLEFDAVGDETSAQRAAVGVVDGVLQKLVAHRIDVFSQAHRPAAYHLTGSVRQRGDDLRVSAQLTRVSDGIHIWSKTYELPSSAGFDAETSVATNLAWSVLRNIEHDSNRIAALRWAPYKKEAIELFFAAQKEQMDISLGEGGDFATFEQLAKDAIEADPNFPWPHAQLAGAYHLELFRGRMRWLEAHPAAHAAIDRARELAPDDFGVRWVGGLVAGGGSDRAFVLWRHALNLVSAGRLEEARPYMAEGWSLDKNELPERYVYLNAAIGDTAEARAILEDPRFDLNNDFALALGHLALGDVEQTFKYIERGVHNRDVELLMSLRLASWWDPIRADPRFDDMLALFDSYATYTDRFYAAAEKNI